MKTDYLRSVLSRERRTQLEAIRRHACTLLDCSPRFKYFTLHGQQHIDNLFSITDIFYQAGIRLSDDQAFLLACAICVHDLGMVIPLADRELAFLFHGKPQPVEPTDLERELRNVHHELVGEYISNHFGFLSDLGLSAADSAIVREVSRCHRKIDLDSVSGLVRSLGALLRTIDELDISPNRAPQTIMRDHFQEMDGTSCWHWFKHAITGDWRIGHTVESVRAANPRLTFKVAVHPPKASSIPYWLTQVRRPISRVFWDEGAARIIMETWGLQLSVIQGPELSTPLPLGDEWESIEEKALSAGRKVILVIDDEARKLVDLFLPLMMKYHVVFAPNAKDGLDKLAATRPDLAIVDLQVGSGFQWSAEETQDFKMTGLRICKDILAHYPETKVGVLTGSRHDLSEVQKLEGIAFLVKKPVDPEIFEREVCGVLS